jgi:hypothetical protein
MELLAKGKLIEIAFFVPLPFAQMGKAGKSSGVARCKWY